ncbi:unnamed protein product [Heterobilharzia americana]|nr:unnamed protein product [Heterobilharzia americana]
MCLGTLCGTWDSTDHAVHASEIKCSKTDPYTSTSLVVHAPILWTRGEVKEFKQCLAEDEESIIRISSGEVYSVRVQTHPSGTSIVWEFATDDYDIGFGLFFEWAEPISDPDIIQNSHILPVNADGSHSEATMSANEEQSNILVDEIIPVTRRNSQTEVCCGSHLYPGPGHTYLSLIIPFPCGGLKRSTIVFATHIEITSCFVTGLYNSPRI